MAQPFESRDHAVSNTTSFDAEVQARLDLIQRWTSAIRHQLGNVLYPSKKMLTEAAQSPGLASKLASGVEDLVETIDYNRLALACVRPATTEDATGATVVGAWWDLTRHILQSVVGRDVNCRGPSQHDRALPASAKGLTAFALPIFIALDLAEASLDSIAVEARSDEHALTIEAKGSGLEQMVIPACALAAAEALGCALTSHAKPGGWVVQALWADEE